MSSLKDVYNALKNDGQFSQTKDYATFARRMNERGYSMQIYNNLKEAGASLPDIGTFRKRLGVHVWTVGESKAQAARNAAAQKRSTPLGRAQQSVASERWGGNDSELVQGLREADAADKDLQQPVDYTSLGAVKQIAGQQKMKQQIVGHHAEMSGRMAASKERRRREQPVVDTGNEDVNNNIVKTQGQLEDEMDKSAARIAGSDFADTFASMIANERSAAEGRALKVQLQAQPGSGNPMTTTLLGTAAYNAERDPAKLQQNLSNTLAKNMESMLGDPNVAQKIMSESARLGVSPEYYAKNALIPAINSKLMDEYDRSELKIWMPRNSFEDIIDGIGDSFLGGAFLDAINTKAQQQYRQRAAMATQNGDNPYYQRDKYGITEAARGGVGLITDAIGPGGGVFGGIGKGVGAVSSKVFANEVKTVANMANMTRLQRVFNPTMLMRGAAESAANFGLYEGLKGAQAYASTTDDVSLGEMLAQSATSAAHGAVSGAALGVVGKMLGGLGYNVGIKGSPLADLHFYKNMAKGLGMKGVQVVGEGTAFYVGGNANNALSGEKMDWSASNLLNNVIAAGVYKLTSTHTIKGAYNTLTPKKGMSYGDSVAAKFGEALYKAAMAPSKQGERFVFTDDEKRQLFHSGDKAGLPGKEGYVGHPDIRTWAERVSKKQEGKDKPDKEGRLQQTREYYEKVMQDPAVSWDAKMKLNALLGIVPAERPLMDFNTYTAEDGRQYVNEYAADGTLLSKHSYRNMDEREAIKYRLGAQRENQRMLNGLRALIGKDCSRTDLQMKFLRQHGYDFNKPDAPANKTLIDEMEGKAHGLDIGDKKSLRDEWLDFVANEGQTSKAIVETAKEYGMTVNEAYKALNKEPLKRTETEQKMCAALRRMADTLVYEQGGAHPEHSEQEGKDVVENNGLGTEEPNNEAVVQTMTDLTKAENALQEAMNKDDVFKQEYERLSKQGLSNAQIYQELINSGVTQEKLAPLADYINANAKVQGMFRGTQQKIEETVQQRVADWGYKGKFNGEKAEGKSMVYVTDSKGRLLIVGAGDVSFGSDGRATEGDMLTVLDPQTNEMDFISAKDVEIDHIEKAEDYANAFRQKLQEINSQGFQAAAEQQTGQQGQQPKPVDNGGQSQPKVEAGTPEPKPMNDAVVNDGKGGKDKNGNILNSDGSIYTERVEKVDDIKDDDFNEPSRSVELPTVPNNVATALGSNGKPIIIKKNIFEKNLTNHPELEPEESRAILNEALYNPDLVGQTQPVKRPSYKVAVKTGDKNSIVVLDVYNGKKQIEIVGWRKINEKGLAKMQRQAEREGGQFLILSPKNGSAAALSALPQGLSSFDKDSESSAHGKGEKQTLTFADGTPMEMDKNGNVVYEKTSVENTVSDLFGRLKLENDEVSGIVAAKRKKAADAIKKLESKKPKPGDDINKYLKEKQTWQEDMDAAKQSADHWEKVAKEIERITTPKDAENWKKELSGEAAHEEYEKDKDSDSEEFGSAEDMAAQFISRAKITPDSFKAETGLGNEEQKKFVGMISKNGKSIKRLAEELMQIDRDDYGGMYFHGDDNAARSAIIEALTSAKSRADLKNRIGSKEKEYTEQHNAARDQYYWEKYHMSYEDYVKMSEQELPDMLRNAADSDAAFEDMMNTIRFQIKTPAQREAAESAYNWAAKHRPNERKQYAIVDMDKPQEIPQYFEKKDFANKEKGYFNKLGWGNYKLFDLDKTFDDNVKSLTGKFPEKFDTRSDAEKVTAEAQHRETVLRDTIVDIMKKHGLDVSMSAEEGQRVLDEANGGNAEVKTQARLNALAKAANAIKSWIKSGKRGKSFTIELPEATQQMIRKVMGRDFDSHNITANGVAHAQKNHGVDGNKLNGNSIPLTDKDMELMPYIMTAPDYVRKGSSDVTGRTSVRFYKDLSNGYVVVAEKEYKNSPDDMEAITMWAEKSDKATNARLDAAPDTHVRNAILDTDAAKIRKDAETAIENDVKVREQKVYHGAKNYVIFDEKDAKITDHVRFFRTGDGEAYGFTVGGKIYIDPRIANAETPIHEYAHLWASALKRGNPKEWEHVVDLMLDTKVWDEVEKNYPELRGNMDAIADEVIATYSGRRGAERLRQMAEEVPSGKAFEKTEAIGTVAKIKAALDTFWKGVADMLHIHYTSAEEVADRVMKDLLDGVDPRKIGRDRSSGDAGSYREIADKGSDITDEAASVPRMQKVTDKKELEKLNKEKTFRMYSGMQERDGKLYSPMAAIIDGKRTDATEIGAWMKADERPDLVKNGKFDLVKTDGKQGAGEGTVAAAYNPYMHTSTSMMNDQFTGAYARGNIKVVEWEIPESEKTSGYRAEGAKDAVGLVPWHSGSVNGLLPKDRQRSVMLSRWRKAVRVVPDSEVAEGIAKQLEGTDLAIPWNVVTPNQLKELAKLGVRITTEETGKQSPETKKAFLKQKAELEKEYPQAKFVDVKMTKDAYKEWGNGSVKKAAKKKPSANPMEGMKNAADAWHEEQRVRLQKKENVKDANEEGKSEDLFVSLQNKKGKEYYDTVTELARRVSEGKARIERLGDTSEHKEPTGNIAAAGYLLGGRLGDTQVLDGAARAQTEQGWGSVSAWRQWKAEADKLGGEIHGQGNAGTRRGETEDPFVRAIEKLQERSFASVEEWAKKNGCHYDEADVKKASLNGKEIGEGCEATVYLDKDKKNVVKVTHMDGYYATPLIRTLDKVKCFNELFPESAYTINGYGRNEYGSFSVVMEQPYYEGETIIKKFNGDYSKANEWLDKFQTELGFKFDHYDDDGNPIWSNGKYTLNDLNCENVIIDKNGKPHVIDCEVLPVGYEKMNTLKVVDNDDAHYRTGEEQRARSQENENGKDGRIVPEDVEKEVSSRIEKKFDEDIEDIEKDVKDKEQFRKRLAEDVERISRTPRSELETELEELKNNQYEEIRREKSGGAEVISERSERGDKQFPWTLQDRATAAAIERELDYRRVRAESIRTAYGLQAGSEGNFRKLAEGIEKSNIGKKIGSLWSKVSPVIKRLGIEINAKSEDKEHDAFGDSTIFRSVDYYIDKIARTSSSPKELPVTILHELIHQGMDHAIQLVNSGKAEGALTPKQIEAVNTILDIYRKAKEQPERFKDNSYGLKNEYEFTAQMADPRQRKGLGLSVWDRVVNFAHELANKGDRSVWQTVKDAVKKLFEISDKDKMDKAIEDVLNDFKEVAHDKAMDDVDENGWSYNDERSTGNSMASPVDKAVERLSEIALKTGEKLGVKVNAVRSAEEITDPQVRRDIESGKAVQGWYDAKTGEVHLYMPNIHCSRDAVKTVWHEVVGHKGMRGLLGDKFNDYMRGLWMDLDNPVNKELREYVRGRMAKEPMSMYDAIEEYLAEAAEKGKGEPGFWTNIKNRVTDALHEIGYRISPNVKDVKYMLWLAKNVQKNPNDPVWKMRAEAVKWRIEHETFEGTKVHGGDFYDNDGAAHDLSDMTRSEWLEATDGEIHYRTAPAAATALGRYHDQLDAHGYMATEAFMDNMLSLKALMQAIDPKTKRIEDVPSSMNPYLMQNIMQGAMSDRMQMFERNVMKPLEKAMTGVLDSFAGRKVRDRIRNFNLYMIRKHGLERNRVLYVRDHTDGSGSSGTGSSSKMDDFVKLRGRLGGELAAGNIDLKEYYRQMDEWIRQNVDAKYDASKHDYSGMHGLQGIMNPKKPYDDAAAIDEVMSQEQSMESMKKGSVQDFWSNVKAATQFSLDADYNSGLVTKATHDRVSAMFDWYVPLRKFDAATAEDVYGYVTDGGTQKGFIGETLMNAKGRRSLSNVEILAQIGIMGNRAVKNGGANEVKQAFARFVRNSGAQNLVRETKVWVVKKGTDTNGNDIWEESYPQIPDGATADQIAQIVDAHEADMLKKQQAGEAKTISDKGDIGLKFERAKDRSQHIVDVKIAGKTHRFVVLGNPRAAQALNGMLENSGASTWGGKVLQTMTRWMAQTATTWSPEFVMRNIIRDAEFASSNVTAKEGWAYGKKWTRYYAELSPLNVFHNEGAGALKSMKLRDLKGGVGYGLYARYREGKLDMNSKIERYFKEFMENGGETGFVQLKDMATLEKEYKTSIKWEHFDKQQKSLLGKIGAKTTTAVPKLIHGFFENVEHLNEVAENMARFATFCTSRDMGRSAARSAYDAKEVSTNFNRHGSGDAVKSFQNGETGAWKSTRRSAYGFLSSNLRNYSMFFNAGIQSTNLLIKNVKNARVSAIGKMMATPFALGLLAALVNKWRIDSEDESERGGVKDPYGELPGYIRRNNLCFYWGKGKFVTIPLAIELRAFYGLGDLAAGQTFAPNVKSQRNVVMDAVGCVSQLFPVIDFMNSEQLDKHPVTEFVKGILPTGLSPFAEWYLNSDWKGARLHREGEYLDNAPAWKRAYQGTPEELVNLNKWVNAKTNGIAPGNPDMKGNSVLDWITDPAMLNHIYGTLGGGAATFSARTGGIVTKAALGKEDEMSTRDLPFWRSVVYTPTEQSGMARTKAKWYSYREDMDKDIANYKALKTKNVPLTQRMENMAAMYKFENSNKARRIRVVESADKQIKKWNDVKKRYADDKRQVDFANRNIEMIMQQAVEQLDKIGD